MQPRVFYLYDYWVAHHQTCQQVKTGKVRPILCIIEYEVINNDKQRNNIEVLFAYILPSLFELDFSYAVQLRDWLWRLWRTLSSSPFTPRPDDFDEAS